jgi:anti-anti-sigma factor
VKHQEKVGGLTDDAQTGVCDRAVMVHQARPPDDRLQVESVPRADGAELRLAGELTLATVSGLQERLRETESADPRVLVLDLREVRFVDSSALAALIAADARSRMVGRHLMLVTGPGTVERLLALTGLDRRFETAARPPGVT